MAVALAPEAVFGLAEQVSTTVIYLKDYGFSIHYILAPM